jgi:hypothetical protein
MTQQIDWKRNNYYTFVANQTIRVGGQHPISVAEGLEFEYDGTVMKYAGAELPNPSLRTAIEQLNWAFLADGGSGGHIAAHVPARRVAKATTVNRDLSKVQRVGGTLQSDSTDENTVMDVSERRGAGMVDRQGHLTGHLDRNNRPNRIAMDVQSGVEDQEGIVVSKIRTPAKLGKVDVVQHSGLAQRLETIGADQGFGRSAAMKETTTYREGVSIKTQVGRIDPSDVSSEEEGTYVSRVRNSRRSSSEGIEILDTSRAGRPRREEQAPAPRRAPPRPAPKKAAKKPVAKSAPKKPAEDLSSLPPRIRTALRIDPEFPRTWSFEGRLVDRFQRIEEHGVSDLFLEAMWAAENDPMRRALEAKYPSLFGT